MYSSQEELASRERRHVCPRLTQGSLEDRIKKLIVSIAATPRTEILQSKVEGVLRDARNRMRDPAPRHLFQHGREEIQVRPTRGTQTKGTEPLRPLESHVHPAPFHSRRRRDVRALRPFDQSIEPVPPCLKRSPQRYIQRNTVRLRGPLIRSYMAVQCDSLSLPPLLSSICHKPIDRQRPMD